MFKNSFSVLLIALALLSSPLKAQVFNGRIVDDKGKVLRYSVIVNQTKKTADFPDSDGYVRITADPGDILLIHSSSGEEMDVKYERGIQEIVFEPTRGFFMNYCVRRIDEDVTNMLNTLYLKERYRECLAYCMYYIGWTTPFSIPNNKRPFENWSLNKGLSYPEGNVYDIATVLYIATIAAEQYSRQELDGKALYFGFQCAKSCAVLFEDYLLTHTPETYWDANKMNEHIVYGQWGLEAAGIGKELLIPFGDEKWVKKEMKWFDKKGDKILDALYNNTLNTESRYSQYPILPYKIHKIELAYNLSKGRKKDLKEAFSDCLQSAVKLIEGTDRYKYQEAYDFNVHAEIRSLISWLGECMTSPELCKKAGKDFPRFCMESLIKLQDISYYLNGASRYSLSLDYTLKDIQDKMAAGDYAIIHFEAPVSPGMLYFQDDLSTRERNYALVISKDQNIPDFWHRGYISNEKVNDLNAIKTKYPDAKRFYFVGTPRMSFIDIAGNDSSVIRLHSLSQILEYDNTSLSGNEILFVGDLNYNEIGDLSYTSHSKGDSFGPLDGPANELMHIETLFPSVRPITGDAAKRNVVMSEISRNTGIVHISTHGTIDIDPEDDISENDLVLKTNVMESSRLILSGFNDNPASTLSYISGSDVLKMKKINSRLVFLDACLSGKGAVGVGGSVGIAEAFHLIGAGNVICYLQPVDDAIATEFSNLFYEAIFEGLSCHDAFFKAKNSVSEDIKVVLWE